MTANRRLLIGCVSLVLLGVLIAPGCDRASDDNAGGAPQDDDDDDNNDNNDNDTAPSPIDFTDSLNPHLARSIPIINVQAEDAVSYLGPDAPIDRVCGDLWPAAWTDEGHLIAANGDGFAFGLVWNDMVVSRIEGLPENLVGRSIPGAWGRNLGELWHDRWWEVSRKPTGMICVDGVLYLFYQNLKNLFSDNNFGDAPAASISWSADNGRTWQWDPSGPMFANHIFTTGMFLDLGRCNRPALDDYVYVYGLDYNWRYSEGYRSTKLYLARVPADQIPDRAAWTFFTGMAKGEPTWSVDIADKTPVLHDETEYAGRTCISQGSIVYIRALNRYLYSTWSDSAWVWYEAPAPWGPWTKAGVKLWHEEPFSDDWFGGYATVTPSKFFAEDGRNGWIVSAIFGILQDRYYRYGMRRITLETAK